MKHNVRLVDLQRAAEEYDLDNDKDVAALRTSNLAEREKNTKEAEEKMKEELKLHPMDKEEV